MADKEKKDYQISLPQIYSCLMTHAEAAQRETVASLLKGVKFTQEGPAPYRQGWVIGTTIVTNLDDLKTLNNLLEPLPLQRK